MTHTDFLALALALREAGAVKVRAGELEVIWPGPFSPSTQAREAFLRSPRASAPNGQGNGRPASAEEARLREFKAELEGEDP